MIKKTMLLLLIGLMGNTYAVTVSKINFQQNGEISKVVIDLDGTVEADKFHNLEDRQIILDLKGASADAKTLRSIDTSQFSGSAVYVKAYPKPGSPNDLRLAVQLRDNVQSQLDNQGNRLILSIENRFGVFSQQDPSKESVENPSPGQRTRQSSQKISNANTEDILKNLVQSGTKQYLGKKISINVRSIQVADLLNMISETAGFNVIIDDPASKRPPVTINLTNVPWDEALDTILNMSRLAAKKQSNILSVTTVENAIRERDEKIDNDKKFEAQEPLMTKVFPISYAKLDDLASVLKEYQTPARGKITKDERTNHLIVKDTSDVVDKMKKIIDLLDTTTPQILIEARIVEALEDYKKEIGFTGLRGTYDPITFVGSTPGGGLGTIGGEVGPGVSFNTAPTSANGSVLGVSVNVFRRLLNLDFQLKLLESENKTKIISSPKIITRNKEEATISSTDETSYKQVTFVNNQAQESWQTTSASVSLKVKPQVTNEGAIAMDLEIAKDSFSRGNSAAGAPPDRTKNNIKTTVLADNGATVVIGGLYRQSEGESHSGIPFLKDIPLLGWLFRTQYNPNKDKRELLVFITPKIMNEQDDALGQNGAEGSGVLEAPIEQLPSEEPLSSNEEVKPETDEML